MFVPAVTQLLSRTRPGCWQLSWQPHQARSLLRFLTHLLGMLEQLVIEFELFLLLSFSCVRRLLTFQGLVEFKFLQTFVRSETQLTVCESTPRLVSPVFLLAGGI